MKKMSLLLLFFILSIVGTAWFLVARKHLMNMLPPIFLWAWEQPQDMRFLKNNSAGVAVYAGIINLKSGNVEFLPRRQPINYDPQTPAMPVIRVESDGGNVADYDVKVGEIARIIIGKCLEEKAIACQIDYDARGSEISLYKKIIKKVRENLPQDLPLSITALVSWCGRDSWLADAPIDEAVPMFFRMGPDENRFKTGLPEDILKEPKCQTSIGISTDESLPSARFLKNKRIYIFSSAPWREVDFNDTLNKIELK